jgi:hypothetical protein
MDLNFYKNNGWVHILDVVPNEIVTELRKRVIKLRKWVDDKQGQPSEFGPLFHWKGVGCAGMYDKFLMEFYNHEIMYDISSELLETKDVWKYNDQVVVKLPNDTFDFKPHTDNTVGGNLNEGGNTVNMCVILDDFTDENGTLQIKDTRVYPKAGDIVAIHGDTPHQSEPNKSDNPRCLYACVYSSEKIVFQNFYQTQFKQNLL